MRQTIRMHWLNIALLCSLTGCSLTRTQNTDSAPASQPTSVAPALLGKPLTSSPAVDHPDSIPRLGTPVIQTACQTPKATPTTAMPAKHADSVVKATSGETPAPVELVKPAEADEKPVSLP